MKFLAIGFATALSALACGAQAQVVKIMEMDDDIVVPAFNITVGELEKQALTDAGGNRIGDVEDVLGTAEGPTAIVIDLENSDLEVIVPLERFQNTGGVLTVNMTPEELAALPAYGD